MSPTALGSATPPKELSKKEGGAGSSEGKTVIKENRTEKEGEVVRTKAESKRAVPSGVPATITSALAARKHHQDAIDTLDKGLEVLDAITEQLQLDAKKGELTNDLSHIASDSSMKDADIIGAMVSVFDERKKPSLEFALGVLGAKEVPAPLLERQRTQGQRAIVVAVRSRAAQKRREAKREAAAARAAKAAKAAAEKAAKEKAIREKAAARQAAREKANKAKAAAVVVAAAKLIEEKGARQIAKRKTAEEWESVKNSSGAQVAVQTKSSKLGKEATVDEIGKPAMYAPTAETSSGREGTKMAKSSDVSIEEKKAVLARKTDAVKTVEIAKKTASVTATETRKKSRSQAQSAEGTQADGVGIEKDATIEEDSDNGMVGSLKLSTSDNVSPGSESSKTKHVKNAESVTNEPRKSRFSALPPSSTGARGSKKISNITGDKSDKDQSESETKKTERIDKKSKESDAEEYAAGIEVENSEATANDATEDVDVDDDKRVTETNKRHSNSTIKQESDSGDDGEMLLARSVKRGKVTNSRVIDIGKRHGSRKRMVRATPSPSPSPLPRLTKPPKKSIQDEDIEDDDSDFEDTGLGPSLHSSSKNEVDKRSSKSAKSKADAGAIESRRARKGRFHQYRTNKGRFTSKQNASGGAKARKASHSVGETSDEDSGSEEEITRAPPKQTPQAKHKRGRKPKEIVGTPKAEAPTGDDSDKRKGSTSDKGFDLSAYQRTPREQRMSGRRTQLEDPGDAALKTSRLRRESSNLKHDDTEIQLWDRNPYMGMCYRAWEKINNFAIAIPFREPVRSDDAPGYYDVIKRPMDLRTVRNRIMNGTLTTPAEFQKDMNQIVRNAMTFNSKDSDIYDVTLLFREKMRKEVEPIVEAWKALSTGKGEDVSEKVAEVQRMANAGLRSSARYPSRRASWKPPSDRSPSPSAPAKKGRGRGRRRSGVERSDFAESEEEKPAATSTKRGSSVGRGRGRVRKSKGTDRGSVKEKDREKAKDKDKDSEKAKEKDRNQASGTRSSKRGNKHVGNVEDEPSGKRRRIGSRKYRDD